ncbi:hypothetical protein POI8812_03061 [Pontivivens insulae]|uniref:Uncharacterized protein n=1 Tax=Pontivivens insulae TaxID=1639689 RepID=A0A2R8AEQ4_9RHOB|nr:hypothetical protein DFR53_2675 [Pontivivens insulae]SPF30719.1 hypothetical protein POI8812_03061 [Pontivivens insulae]
MPTNLNKAPTTDPDDAQTEPITGSPPPLKITLTINPQNSAITPPLQIERSNRASITADAPEPSHQADP